MFLNAATWETVRNKVWTKWNLLLLLEGDVLFIPPLMSQIRPTTSESDSVHLYLYGTVYALYILETHYTTQ